MSSTIPLPPREQLYNRYNSNKHTHMPGSDRAPTTDKYNILYIKYINEDNYIKYTGEKPNEDNTQEIENDDDSYTDYQRPEEQQIEDADNYGVEYEEDEEDEESFQSPITPIVSIRERRG